VEAGRSDVNARTKGLARLLLGEGRANSIGVIITSSLFLGIMGAALLVVGHAVIGPMLKAAMADREAKATGDVVYTMPDGVFCRHMSFDNATAEVIEGAIVRCPDNAVRGGANRAAKNFAWGAH
jgi:hypothetical protein